MNTDRRRLGARFWVEVALASITGFLFVLTLFWHDWIEVFGIEPDGGDGSFEWMLVGVLFACTLVLTAAAGWEWRRAGAATA